MIENDSFILTEKTSYSSELNLPCSIEYLEQVNRTEKLVGFKFIKNTILSLKYYFKYKPDVIISTGALATIPICILSKIFRKKVIFIESFAKTNSKTLSGKFVYKFADLFYVQWETMLKEYPKAKYKGTIY